MIPRHVIRILVVAALFLPISICMVGATGKLLDALGDEGGAILLKRSAVVLGLLWVLDMIVLAIGQGINSLFDPPK